MRPENLFDVADQRAFDADLLELEHGSHGQKTEATATATEYDLRDMRLLELDAEFRRRFKGLAMVGFSSTVVIAWQNILTTLTFALFNGGTGGLFWTFLYSVFAMSFVYLTLGELSSSFPTAGGQYQWVVECAPMIMRKPLSYSTGWLLALGWQTWLASCGVAIGNIIKFCILLYYPNSIYINSQWFPTLIAILALILGGIFNLYCTRRFAFVEGVMLVIHTAGWLAVVVTLWVTSPRGKASDVLFTFSNGGGWANAAVATLVGTITGESSILGYDSPVHMTEKVIDASRTIPLALMWSYFTNAGMAFIMLITIIFCAGDIEEDVSNISLSTFIVIFRRSTGSNGAAVAMTLPILLTLCSAMLSQQATASSQLWAFARDGGVPYASWFRHLHVRF